MKKNTFLCVALLLLSPVLLFSQSAKEIVKKAKTQVDLSSLGTRAKMQIQKDGKTLNILVIDQYSSKDKNGLQRTLIDFKEPAIAKGTRFLMQEKQDGSMDQRIFLPSLKKVKRIATESDGSESFMGTDFSYNDVSFMTRDAENDDFTMLEEKKLDGKDCYVIEGKPKDANYSYAKTILFISKQDNMILKVEFYNKENMLVKTLELSNYKKIQNVLTPMQTKLSTISTNTSTIIELQKVNYGMQIPEKVFTTKYLETGR
ncbi:MAG: outer membrane lipoprotein-sorting protein [Treponema sp.]